MECWEIRCSRERIAAYLGLEAAGVRVDAHNNVVVDAWQGGSADGATKGDFARTIAIHPTAKEMVLLC